MSNASGMRDSFRLGPGPEWLRQAAGTAAQAQHAAGHGARYAVMAILPLA